MNKQQRFPFRQADSFPLRLCSAPSPLSLICLHSLPHLKKSKRLWQSRPNATLLSNGAAVSLRHPAPIHVFWALTCCLLAPISSTMVRLESNKQRKLKHQDLISNHVVTSSFSLSHCLTSKKNLFLSEGVPLVHWAPKLFIIYQKYFNLQGKRTSYFALLTAFRDWSLLPQDWAEVYNLLIAAFPYPSTERPVSSERPGCGMKSSHTLLQELEVTWGRWCTRRTHHMGCGLQLSLYTGKWLVGEGEGKKKKKKAVVLKNMISSKTTAKAEPP